MKFGAGVVMDQEWSGIGSGRNNDLDIPQKPLGCQGIQGFRDRGVVPSRSNRVRPAKSSKALNGKAEQGET